MLLYVSMFLAEIALSLFMDGLSPNKLTSEQYIVFIKTINLGLPFVYIFSMVIFFHNEIKNRIGKNEN